MTQPSTFSKQSQACKDSVAIKARLTKSVRTCRQFTTHKMLLTRKSLTCNNSSQTEKMQFLVFPLILLASHKGQYRRTANHIKSVNHTKTVLVRFGL